MKSSAYFLTLALCLFIFSQCNNANPPEASAANEKTEVAPPQYDGFASEVEWGRHIVTVSGCHDCHTPKKFNPQGWTLDSSRMLSGHPSDGPKIDINRKEMAGKGLAVTSDLTEWVGPWGTSYAANLTPDPSGIGSWKEEQFFLALREGKFKGLPNSRPILPPMPWDMFRHMTDGEIKAIFAYLKSIPPIANVVPPPLPPGASK
jgi:hypothetical protein